MVTNPEVTKRFYVDGLGALLNAESTNDHQVHVNVGLSQFHLPFAYKNAREEKVVAQTWAGFVEMTTLEDVKNLHRRLGKMKYESRMDDEDGVLYVRCPNGNRFRVRSQANPKMFRTLLDSHKLHHGGTGSLISFPLVEHPVLPDTAEVIARFYSEVLNFDAKVVDRGGTCAIVEYGIGGHCQQMVFKESEKEALPFDAYDKDPKRAYHIAVYYHEHERFLEAFERCRELGIVYVNPRFPTKMESSQTLDDVKLSHQFRIKDMCDPSDRDTIAFVLEHEIRSPRHSSCPFRKT